MKAEMFLYSMGNINDDLIADAEKDITVKKNYGFARVEEVLEASKDRVNPRCSKARQCGG